MRYRVKEYKMVKQLDNNRSTITTENHDLFSSQVNQLITEGWEVYGEFVYRPDTSDRHGCFFQAMVKYYDPFDQVSAE